MRFVWVQINRRLAGQQAMGGLPMGGPAYSQDSYAASLSTLQQPRTTQSGGGSTSVADQEAMGGLALIQDTDWIQSGLPPCF